MMLQLTHAMFYLTNDLIDVFCNVYALMNKTQFLIYRMCVTFILLCEKLMFWTLQMCAGKFVDPSKLTLLPPSAAGSPECHQVALGTESGAIYIFCNFSVSFINMKIKEFNVFFTHLIGEACSFLNMLIWWTVVFNFLIKQGNNISLNNKDCSNKHNMVITLLLLLTTAFIT